MKLSLRSEYALLSLIHIARSSRACSLAQIAAAQDISLELLVEVLTVLNHSGYLGQADGSYRLNNGPENVSVAEIIRLFDGALAPCEPVSSRGYAVAPMDKEEKLTGMFDQLQAQIAARLEGTTIADLV
ncbi:MAG: Rrf2 family transcriptional regulator [Geobacteraceae bacterium]|nr:Rrf2 family transcriptional regulator [Geobacteraceae bacterium]